MTKEKYQLLPELPPEQFEALKADIAERGVVVPMVVDEFGAILDGHNRARACRELGINDYPVRKGATLCPRQGPQPTNAGPALRAPTSLREGSGARAEWQHPGWLITRAEKGNGIHVRRVPSSHNGRTDRRFFCRVPRYARRVRHSRYR